MLLLLQNFCWLLEEEIIIITTLRVADNAIVVQNSALDIIYCALKGCMIIECRKWGVLSWTPKSWDNGCHQQYDMYLLKMTEYDTPVYVNPHEPWQPRGFLQGSHNPPRGCWHVDMMEGILTVKCGMEGILMVKWVAMEGILTVKWVGMEGILTVKWGDEGFWQ